MPLKTKAVTLSEPFIDADLNIRITTIVLREPSAAMFFEIGPLSANYAKNDVYTAADLDGVLKSYLSRCVTNIDFAHIDLVLRALPLRDGVAIRRTFGSFFDEAIEAVLLDEGAIELARQIGRPAAGGQAAVAN